MINKHLKWLLFLLEQPNYGDEVNGFWPGLRGPRAFPQKPYIGPPTE